MKIGAITIGPVSYTHLDVYKRQYLEREGYESQILEFIDMEHTPKNILIRAVKKASGCDRKKAAEEIRRCEELLCVHPVLGTLLDEKRRNK